MARSVAGIAVAVALSDLNCPSARPSMVTSDSAASRTGPRAWSILSGSFILSFSPVDPRRASPKPDRRVRHSAAAGP